MLRSREKLISRKKTGSSIKKFLSLVLPGNITTVTAPYYQISSLLSVSGRLREVKNKRKFQTFSSKSGRGRLREVVCYKRFQIWWFDRKTFGISENWSLRRGGRNWRFDCIWLGKHKRSVFPIFLQISWLLYYEYCQERHCFPVKCKRDCPVTIYLISHG